MFIYASRFFNKLQKKKKYLSQVSSQKSPEPNARKLSTQISVKVKNQKANIEKWVNIILGLSYAQLYLV